MPDVVKSLYTLVSANWTKGNTNNLTPIFFYGEIGSEAKRVDTAETAIIRFYQASATSLEPNGLGKTTQRAEYPVSVDIRTSKSRAHSILLVEEVKRIMNNKIVDPDSSFAIADIEEERDLSPNNASFWHWVLEYTFRNYNITRPT